MRIVHINLFDALGGAASTAWTLMKQMPEEHEVHIFAHRKTTNDPRVIPLAFPETHWQKKLLQEQSRQGLFDVYSAALLKLFTSEIPKPIMVGFLSFISLMREK